MLREDGAESKANQSCKPSLCNWGSLSDMDQLPNVFRNCMESPGRLTKKAIFLEREARIARYTMHVLGQSCSGAFSCDYHSDDLYSHVQTYGDPVDALKSWNSHWTLKKKSTHHIPFHCSGYFSYLGDVSSLQHFQSWNSAFKTKRSKVSHADCLWAQGSVKAGTEHLSLTGCQMSVSGMF